MTDKPQPDKTHPQYDEMRPVWQMCRAVVTGQRAVHNGKATYLPELAGQSDDDYKNYLTRAVFFNATGRTVDGMAGLIFRKYPNIVLPPALKAYEEDIDLAGLSLFGMAQAIVEDVLTVGRAGLMVDYPSADISQPLTVGQAQAVGLRPYLKSYKAESIINWHYTRLNNAMVLGSVFLFESDEQIRELALIEGEYWQIVWHKGKEGWHKAEEYKPIMNGKPMNFIPFWFCQAQEGHGEIQEPPIEDLCHLNLAHYRNSADYENALHVAGQPTPWVSDLDQTIDANGNTVEQKLHLGSNTFLRLGQNGKAGFLQIGRDGLIELREAMAEKKTEMAALGARILEADKRQAEAAETAEIKRTGENSVLATIAGAVDMSFIAALKCMAEWMDLNPDEIVFELNKSYLSIKMDSNMLRELIGAWQQGAISYESLWRALQQGEVVSESDNFEDEQRKISEERPNIGYSALAAAFNGVNANDGQ